MMYINIKKLYSWRIRPYKIPCVFFPLLFPFLSLFSSLFFFPPFPPLFPFFPPHGVRVCPSLGPTWSRTARVSSANPRLSNPFSVSNPAAEREWTWANSSASLHTRELGLHLCDVTLPSYADASSSRWLKLRQLVKVKVSNHDLFLFFS